MKTRIPGFILILLCLALALLLAACAPAAQLEESEESAQTEAPEPIEAVPVKAEEQGEAPTRSAKPEGGLEVVFEDFSSESVEMTAFSLTKEEKQAFYALIEPYVRELSTDVLEEEFLSLYTVQLSDSITVQIGADCHYPERPNESYMFVIKSEEGKTFLCGTYVDGAVADYLAERKG